MDACELGECTWPKTRVEISREVHEALTQGAFWNKPEKRVYWIPVSVKKDLAVLPKEQGDLSLSKVLAAALEGVEATEKKLTDESATKTAKTKVVQPKVLKKSKPAEPTMMSHGEKDSDV